MLADGTVRGPGVSITKLVGLRRRRIETRLRNILFLSSRERMVHMLLELIDSYGDRLGNALAIRLPLTHQDLASLIGVTRETVTVILGQLQFDRLVKVQRRRITVLDCAVCLRRASRCPRISPLEVARWRQSRNIEDCEMGYGRPAASRLIIQSSLWAYPHLEHHHVSASQ